MVRPFGCPVTLPRRITLSDASGRQMQNHAVSQGSARVVCARKPARTPNKGLTCGNDTRHHPDQTVSAGGVCLVGVMTGVCEGVWGGVGGGLALYGCVVVQTEMRVRAAKVDQL